jgi:arginine/ornithine transport system substrate-binding protein
MKVQCSMVTLEFDAMIGALNAKKIDAIVASMSITEERMKLVDFSDKYYHTPARLVVKNNSGLTPTPEGMKGKRIGVQKGTTYDAFVSSQFTQSTIVRASSQEAVYKDLVAGRIDAVLVDSVNASTGFFKTPEGRDFGFAGQVYLSPRHFGYGAGVAVRKTDGELKKRFNEAIAAIRANGTYKRLNDKYFDFDVYGGAPIPIPK